RSGCAPQWPWEFPLRKGGHPKPLGGPGKWQHVPCRAFPSSSSQSRISGRGSSSEPRGNGPVPPSPHPFSGYGEERKALPGGKDKRGQSRCRPKRPPRSVFSQTMSYLFELFILFLLTELIR